MGSLRAGHWHESELHHQPGCIWVTMHLYALAVLNAYKVGSFACDSFASGRNGRCARRQLQGPTVRPGKFDLHGNLIFSDHAVLYDTVQIWEGAEPAAKVGANRILTLHGLWAGNIPPDD